MEYTRSDAFKTDSGTGRRMHQATEPVTTEVTPEDLNMLIWSLMEFLNEAGITGATFNPADPNTYRRLFQSVFGRLGSDDVAEGATLIGYRERNVLTRLDDDVNILDYGGTPDNATNNYAAMLAARTKLGGTGRVRFPFVPGTPNVYSFTIAPPLTYSVFDGHEIDVDDGVVLSFSDDGFLYTTASYKVTRAFRFFDRILQFYSWVTNRRSRPLADKAVFLGSKDLDCHTLKPIVCNTGDLVHQRVGWPAGDSFSAAVPTATSVSGVQWTNPNTNEFSISFARVQPGDEISCYFDGIVAAPTIVAMVRGSGGYGGVYAGVTDDGAGTQIFRKDIGQAAVNVDVQYFGKGTHASYTGVRSLWTIRIVTWNTYVVLFNGMQVATGAVSGPIEEAGFGVYCTNACSAVPQDWVIRRNNSINGISMPLAFCVFGDSLTAKRYESWPQYMRETLEGTLGIRVVQLTNRAISGDNLAGQWDQMNTLGIDGANSVLVLVGTNDIQAETDKAGYQANLQNMLTYCNTRGATLSFGIPPMFYGRAQAGTGVGQAAVNFQKGAYIRAAVQRFCADHNLRCFDLNQQLGPVLANFVNPAATPYWGADPMNDPMFMDSIHPGAFCERLIGVAAAKTAAAVWATQGNNYVPGTLYLAPAAIPTAVALNGWAFTTEAPTWESDDQGNIGLAGVIDKGTGSLADGTVVMQLRRQMRPRSKKRVLCATSVLNKPCVLFVDTDGQVRLYGADVATTFVYLNAMAWNIKQA